MAQNVNENLELIPVKSGPLRVRTFETLKEAIFAGKLQPGDAIREAHMARALQVSQPTLREALIQLEHLGLIVRNPQRDTVVTRLTEDDIRERGRLRAILEAEAAADAVSHVGSEEAKVLDQKLEAIHRTLEADEYHSFVAADLDFHRYVWQLSGNRTLYKLLDLVTVPLFAFLSIRRSRTLKHLANIVRPHAPMVEALKSGDPERARNAFREHIETSYLKYNEVSPE